MVGTFYRASSPTAEPYVSEGDLVKEGQILCIIEAMKLMNEIESKAAGRDRQDPRRERAARRVRPIPVPDRPRPLSNGRGAHPEPPPARPRCAAARRGDADARLARGPSLRRGAAWSGRRVRVRPARADARALTEEAIRLYAAGQFPRACEKFGLAAADDPAARRGGRTSFDASRAGAGTRFARDGRTRPRCCSRRAYRDPG